MLRIRVLGPLEVEGDRGPIELGTGWRARELLAWLAIHPGEHPRAALAAQFWPDVLDSSARASLRTALWALRRALGPDADGHLDAARHRVSLDADVDLVAFEAAVAADRCPDAVALCRGDLLADVAEEWAHEPRERHRRALDEVLARLSRQAADAGDLAAAADWAHRRVALDPLDENAQRDLIELLARAGRRSAALAAFGHLRDRLRRELGVAPDPATRALMARLREDGGDEPAVTGRLPLPRPVATAALDPLVGRAAELARIRAAWDGGRWALLAGEPGIGKTRLACELAREAHRGGAAVLYGACDEDAAIPYQPFAEALSHAAHALADPDLQAAAGDDAPALARLSPELGRRLAVQPADVERATLFAAYGQVLERLAGDGRLLVVLEDLHWADRGTAALVRHLSRHGTERVAAILTYRDTDADGGVDGAPVEAAAGVARERDPERVELRGLAPADVEQLASVWLSDVPADAAAMHRETAGNPFFVRELARHRAAAGTGIPASIRDVVARRLGHLSEPCRRALVLAAVAGRTFDLDVLVAVSGEPPDVQAEVLEEAVAAGAVVELGVGRYAFAHALLRDEVHAGLTATRRAHLHRRVAEALERLDGGPREAEIAHHLLQAGRTADAAHTVDRVMAAARAAEAARAYERAVRLYGGALAVIGDGAGDAELRATLDRRRWLAYSALTHQLIDSGRIVGDDELA